jgi:hypothetical protein
MTSSPSHRRFQRPVVPDRLDLRDRPYTPPVSKAPPSRVNSLEGMQIRPLSQEKTNACTGFALSACINVLLGRAGRIDEAPVSPFMLYDMARRYDEFSGPAKADTGSSLRGAMKGWYKHGVCGADLWRLLDMPPATLDKSDWWLDAARRPLGAYYRVDTRSVTDMHAAIHDVGVLYASAICHEGWDEGSHLTPAQRRGWAIPYRKAAQADGGHAFVIVGYDKRGFLILNSWGSDWADDGLAVLTYDDWLEHAMDCWVAQLGVPTEQHLEIAQAASLRTDAAGAVRLAADPVLRNREIAPFVIDMENNGELSRTGDFRTQESDVKTLVVDHLREFRKTYGLEGQVVDIAIYAHGGLTGEEAAVKTAAKWIPALYQNRIFPIFLMWETDLFSTVANRCRDLIAKLTAEPRPTAGLRDQLQRFWNTRVERTLAEPGSWLWDEMKQNAEAITNHPRSGARILYEASHGIIAPGQVRLHLIGHSAGAIVESYMVQGLAAAGWEFESINFMAPAVRVDTFVRTVLPQMQGGRVKRYHQLHLSEEMEQQDPTCQPLCGYGRSLLYLVSESFEHGRRTNILGIAKHHNAMLADLAPYVRQLMASWSAPMAGSMSTTHGGFDDDDRALETVIKLIHNERVAGVPTATGVDEAASSAPSPSLDDPGPVATLKGSAGARPFDGKRKAPRTRRDRPARPLTRRVH